MSHKKRNPVPGGNLEFAVLAALWAHEDQRLSARELYTEVGVPRHIVYTTVAKVLDRLVEKRLIRRRRSGRTYLYSPIVEQTETHQAMARTLIERITGDDPAPALAALLGAMEDVSPQLLDQLEAELLARKGRR